MTKAITEFRGEYRWLSNFEGGVEQMYQSAKSTDLGERLTIRQATAYEAKRLGRPGVLKHPRADWKHISLRVMRYFVRQKFVKPEYRDRLLATGDAAIIEGNRWHDTFYGCCLCPTHKGEGENHLGLILMNIRTELRLASLPTILMEEHNV